MIAGSAAWMPAPTDPSAWFGVLILALGCTTAAALAAWPAAIAAAVLAPFGLADAPLEIMANGHDLIAAIGQTFGERGEAVQAVPKPPDIAFCICVLALMWACLWRGAPRWLSAPIFAPASRFMSWRLNQHWRSTASCAPFTDATMEVSLGGATITETPLGLRITRAWPPAIRRAWTPQARSADQE